MEQVTPGALEGHPVEFQCYVMVRSGVSAQAISWFLQGLKISGDGRKFTLNETREDGVHETIWTATLHIDPVQNSDNGKSFCLSNWWPYDRINNLCHLKGIGGHPIYDMRSEKPCSYTFTFGHSDRRAGLWYSRKFVLYMYITAWDCQWCSRLEVGSLDLQSHSLTIIPQGTPG